jgi:hypothetical protein
MCFDGVKRLCHIRGKLRKKVSSVTYFLFPYCEFGWPGCFTVNYCLTLLPAKRNKLERNISWNS